MSGGSRVNSPHPYRTTSALFTDLYEINMASVYFDLNMFEPAVFSLFCRRLPPSRPFIVFCGLKELLQSLETLRFCGSDIEYLKSLGLYRSEFLEFLGDFSFTGSVRAMAEGSVAFAQEPVLEVTAPLPIAQIVETLVINKIQHATLVASKAALCYIAARGRALVDFGARRAHSPESAATTARAAYIAGFQATSNLEAAALYGIPPAGTMAHSFVQAFGDETEAFRAFAQRFGERSILLIDTFQTLEGARKAAKVAKEFEAQGVRLRGVRIDSGNLAEYAIKVRQILDEAGCNWMQIFASGNISDHKIAEVVEGGIPVDAFGVGTELSTSSDAPNLDIVYKLVRYADRDVVKLSPQKATFPGPKQVYRALKPDDTFAYDILVPARFAVDDDRGTPSDLLGITSASEWEKFSDSGMNEEVLTFQPLLTDVMADGKTTTDVDIDSARSLCLSQLERLPEEVRSGHISYEVRIHPSLIEPLPAI